MVPSSSSVSRLVAYRSGKQARVGAEIGNRETFVHTVKLSAPSAAPRPRSRVTQGLKSPRAVVCPLACAVLQCKELLGATGMEGAANMEPENCCSFGWADVWY